MVDRINLILKAKNLTSRQFAEEIGIQPSGMSHILSGRNRPSLDFVMKVINRYPEIDIKWLTLGEGEMIKSSSVPSSPVHSSTVSSTPVASATAPSATVQKNDSPMQPDLFSMMETESEEAGKENGEDSRLIAPEQEAAITSTDINNISQEPLSMQTPNLMPMQASTQAAVQTPNQAPTQAPVQTPNQMPSKAPVLTPNQAPTQPIVDNQGNSVVEDADDGKREASTNKGKRITKIVILYEDHTFAEYFPE